MYAGSTMSMNQPILPVSTVNTNTIADYFDERTVINDDLNMNNFLIYNLKDPEDDQDATTKIYVDTKQYNINSANIIGDLPWSRINNIPTFFPSRISNITIDSDINLGSHKITKNGQEIMGLTNNSVITNYISNNAVTNDKILSLDYSKLTNVPSSTSTPIGGIILWSSPNIPQGYLECNGSAVNSSQYPDLANLMTHVPDLRGVFVRGLDKNRGYDTGRVLNSYQADTYQNHSHNIQDSGNISLSGSTTTSNSGLHSHMTALAAEGNDGTWGNTNPVMFAESIGGNANRFLPVSLTSSEGEHNHFVSLTVTEGNHNHGGSKASSGTNETRPKNVALIYIIRGK